MFSEKNIFQEKALAKLKRDDKIGEAFTVVPSIGWVAVSAVCLVIFSILIWSFFGVLSKKVTGYGIVLEAYGSTNIAPLVGGRIGEINVNVGDTVSKGEIVAVLEQKDIEQEIFLSQGNVQEAKNNMEVNLSAAELASTKEKYYRNTYVKSPYDGIITSVNFRKGEIVSAGQTLFELKGLSEYGDCIVAAYVPAIKGGKIKKGMVMQIMPNAQSITEEGALIGRVINVSEYPVSKERIAFWTGNAEFASWIMQQTGGAVTELIVELFKDAEKNKYVWTTEVGEQEVSSGMICMTNVIVEREAPVARAFKTLTQWLRSD